LGGERSQGISDAQSPRATQLIRSPIPEVDSVNLRQQM
jgi:hypothetical protein